MTEETQQEIVVTGRRDSSGAVVGFFNSSPGTPRYSQSEVSENPEGGAEELPPPIEVKVVITDPANKDRALEAARKLIVSIAQLLIKLESANSTATVFIQGKSYDVMRVINDLKSTEFTVTDGTDFGNPGVGSSARGQLGFPNVDIINMDAILNGYGHPNYTNNSGMMSLLLHELGHMSEIGNAFFLENASFYDREPMGSRGNFYPSEYSRNNEAFANDFMNAIAQAVGLNLYGTLPGGELGAIPPIDIYNSHTTR